MFLFFRVNVSKHFADTVIMFFAAILIRNQIFLYRDHLMKLLKFGTFVQAHV